MISFEIQRTTSLLKWCTLLTPHEYFQYKSTITARPIKIYIHFIKIHHLKEYYYDNLTRFKGTLHAKHYKKENERNGQ